MKRKKRPQIAEVFITSQAVGALLLILVLVANFLFLYRKEREIMVSQQKARVQVICSETNVRIRESETAVSEILSVIHNQYDGFRTDDAQQKTVLKGQLSRYLVEKKSLQPEFEYLFVIKPGDFTIFHGEEMIFPRLNLKDYLESHCRELTSSSNQWRILDMGEKAYFLRCGYYRDTDICVGLAFRAETMVSELVGISNADGLTLTLTDSFGSSYSYDSMDGIRVPGSYFDREELYGNLVMEYGFVQNFLQFMQKDLVFLILVILLVFVLTFGFSSRRLHTRVIRPVQEISRAMEDLGDLTELRQIPEQAPVEELSQLETTVNGLLRDVVYSHMKLYTTELQKKSQELRLLRSQLRPHFFLNAITTVSTMTYQNQGEEIRQYLINLSAFLRYIFSSEDPTATLEEEVSCLENYLKLQETRYPGRLFWFPEVAEELKTCRIPRFLLLTVGENAVKYGMKSEDVLQIYISCRQEENFALIAVEDNGPGFDPSQVAFYNRQELPETTEEHLGLSNIKRSLALQYGRTDLLRVSQAVPEGARVEIRIPLDKE